MRLGLQVPNFTWPNGQRQLGDTFGLIAERLPTRPAAQTASVSALW
jgi:hypothetical protein